MQPPASEQILFQGSDFADWASLNDTIMGGRSRAGCRVTPDGLVLEGDLVESVPDVDTSEDDVAPLGHLEDVTDEVDGPGEDDTFACDYVCVDPGG